MRGGRGAPAGPALALAAALCAGPGTARGEDSVTYDIFVDASAYSAEGMRPNTLQADTIWLGAPTSVPLRDDGAPPDAVAGDGTWSARISGPPVRFLRLRVSGTLGQGRRPVAWESVERVLAPADALYLSGHFVAGLPQLRRLSGLGDLAARQGVERRHLRLALGWAAFNGVLAILLARHARFGAARRGAA